MEDSRQFLIFSDAESIRDHFETEAAFVEYLNMDYGTHVADLECLLKKFVEAEMYEECVLIKRVLDQVLYIKFYCHEKNI